MRNKTIGKNNKSGYVGVCWAKKELKWKSTITINKNKIFLGYFTNKEDAIEIRKEAERKYFGEFASNEDMNNSAM